MSKGIAKNPSVTVSEQKRHINEMVEESVSRILNVLTGSGLDKKIHALILCGALSRNEGTIVRKDDEVRILSDMDLEFVLKYPWDFFFFRKKILALLEKLTLPFEVSIGLSWRINAYPTIQLYETKKTGKVIYGNTGILDSITTDSPDQIPKWEGIRLLLNRLIGLIDILTKHRIRALTENVDEEFYYACTKTYLACCDDFLLLENQYAPTYRERYERFVQIFRSSRLRQEIPDLEDKVIEAMKFKLGLENFSEIPTKSMRLWFDCRDTLLETLKYSLSIYLQIREKKLEFLLEELKRKTPRGTFGFLNFLNTILNERKFPFSSLILKPPKLYVQIASFYLAQALNEDLRANLGLMRLALGYLRTFENGENFRIHLDGSIRTWKKLASVLCNVSNKAPDNYVKEDFR